jgi:rhomboid protease GluP
MAFGFSPKYIQEYKLDELSKEHFLVVAKEAAQQLKWDVSFVSETGFIAYTKISMTSWSEQVSVKVENDTATIKSECAGAQLFDWGKNKGNVKNFLAKIAEGKDALPDDEVVSKWGEMQQNFASGKDDVLSRPPLSGKEKLTGFFSIFKPVDGYFITPILMILNITVFALMVISGIHFLMPESQHLLDWGANFRPMTLEGQPWRLFTSCFLHIGVIHLLMNMYALLYIGVLLEPYLGKTRFLAAYLISGIAASMASLWWNDLTISAGASGAIFGMYGVFLALLSTNLLDRSAKKTLLVSIGVFVGYNLLSGLEPESGIDNAAHIGGLLSGLVIGYAYVPGLKQFENSGIKFSTIGVLTVVLLLSSYSVYNSIPNDIVKYDEKMEEFISLEKRALAVYDLPENTPDDKILYEFRGSGIFFWNKSLKLIESCYDLDLPEPVIERNRRLMDYCKLRIKSYELIAKSIEEDSDGYQNEIIRINQEIESIIGELMAMQ